MNARTISLPDLVTEKRRNTALSLTEGFAGAKHEGSLAATAQNWCPRPGQGAPLVGQKDAGKELQKILPVYYRTRQLALSTEKGGHRMPTKLSSELRGLEKALARELRPVHPLFFQRFDDLQLDRFLRAMPFLRLSAGRWIFGADTLVAQWPEEPNHGERVFLLLQGNIALYPDPAGAGERRDVYRGDIFGEKSFMLGDEGMRDYVAGAAHCEEPCIVGILNTASLAAAYSDRAFGNTRIAQSWRKVPSMARICQPDEEVPQPGGSPGGSEGGSSPAKEAKAAKKAKEDANHGAVATALRDLSKVATAVHVSTGAELLSNEPLEESVLVVCKGSLEVRGDITLTEKLDALPPKKVRVRVHIQKATQLAGDSLFDKLDPYCICKMGDFKRFQTPVMNNAGVNPKFDYEGVLTYSGEPEMEFIVMDHDRFSADDLCGNGTLKVADLPNGWHGKVDLKRPKRGIYKSDSTHEEDAGRVVLTVKWDYEPITASSVKPKQKLFEDQVLFELGAQGCWGHEQLMMGNLFRRTLEQAAHGMKYNLTLGDFKVVGATPKGVQEVCTAWKVTRKRFNEFIRQCAREKQFMQACRVSSLEKQNHIRDLVVRLVKKWETEELMSKMSKFMTHGLEDDAKEEVMDPSHFRIAYRDVKARITVRNALNLTGGGMFDKLDPYAVVRFRGSKLAPFKTSVLEDAGSDPFWAAEGCKHKGALLYNGETALEVSVWDYDRCSADDLIATGVIQVEQFCRGFEGSVPLNLPDGKKRKANMKQMFIVMGVQWDPPKDPNAGTLGKSATLKSGMAQIANQTY